MNLPHIEVGTSENGQNYVSVEDIELFDAVADHLIEVCNIEYKSVLFDESHPVKGTMFFPHSISIQQIEIALSKLPAQEISRIFRINNPQ